MTLLGKTKKNEKESQFRGGGAKPHDKQLFASLQLHTKKDKYFKWDESNMEVQWQCLKKQQRYWSGQGGIRSF